MLKRRVITAEHWPPNRLMLQESYGIIVERYLQNYLNKAMMHP